MWKCSDPCQQAVSSDPKGCSCCSTEVTPVALRNKTMGQIEMFPVQNSLYSQDRNRYENAINHALGEISACSCYSYSLRQSSCAT